MSKTSTKAQWGAIKDRGWAIIIISSAVALFGVTSWAWWHYIRSNPERTFYAALENSLRARGVSRTVRQVAGSQELEQKVQLNLTTDHMVKSETSISQSGTVDAKVKTETISTPDAQYVRYTEIKTNEKNSKGEDVDFSELINVWGVSEATSPNQSTSELYGESVLGVIPVGNLNADERINLMNSIRENNIYEFDNSKVEKSLEDGRPIYTYNITVAPEQYVAMLKQFASDIGLTSLENVDPAQYKDSPPLDFKVRVDVWSQSIVGIEYSGGARKEALNSYGIYTTVDEPMETIPLQDLQVKLQEIQTQ